MSTTSKVTSVARTLLALLFIVAGALHFVVPETYAQMIPTYLPWHLPLVYISGVFEVFGGLGLLHPTTRRVAGWGLMLLLLAVFPANLHMAINQVAIEGLPITPVGLWIRLPFQVVFLACVWWCALRRHPETA